MKWRKVATLLPSLLAFSGCTTTFDISPAQVPCIRSGTVRTLEGSEQTVGGNYSVRLIPPEGTVLLRDRNSGFVVAVPEYDEPMEKAKGLEPIEAFDGPIFRILDDGTYLSVDGFRIRQGSVETIHLAQLSPGKTAVAVVLPVVGGIGFIAVMVASFSNFSVGGFGR